MEPPKVATELILGDIPSWCVTLGASLLTAIAGFVLALVNRGPAMQQVIAASTKNLIDGYEKRVAELMAEVTALRVEVIALRKAIFKVAGHGMPHEPPQSYWGPIDAPSKPVPPAE